MVAEHRAGSMSRLAAVAGTLVVMMNITNVRAVSWPIQGEPLIFEDRGRVCFRADKYYYLQTLIPFLSRSRYVDERDVQLLELSVTSDVTDWWISHKNAPASGLRLRRSMAICYGDVPVGFVATQAALPLAAGRYDVQMDAREGTEAIRLYKHFCLSPDKHLISCEGDGKRPSFLEQLGDWIFGE